LAENSAKGTLIKRLAPLDAVSIESPMTGLGIPDVNCTLGWIECKAMRAWPKTADYKPVKFPHPLMQEQKVWLYRRARAGGVALVCVKVSNSWFFFCGLKIWQKKLWENMTRPQMYEEADIYFDGKLDQYRLIRYLEEKWQEAQTRR
jgi:hypothetical protein